MSKIVNVFSVICSLLLLNGCVAVTVVGVAASAIGTTVDVIDAVTPDIIGDDEVEVEDEDDKSQ